MSARTLVVAGLGRCGSSLTMQMLAAAGLRCAGSFPDFEAQPTLDGEIPTTWLASFGGGAVKVLDPHRARLPADVDGCAIWLDRDLREQARSAVKFASILGYPRPSRAEVRTMEAALRVDRRVAKRAIPDTWPKIEVSYDRLLKMPRYEIGVIAGFLCAAGFGQVDQDAMFRCIRKRDPRCSPDLAMEEALVTRGAA